MGKKSFGGWKAWAFMPLVLLSFQNCSKVDFNEAPSQDLLSNTPSTLQGIVTDALTGQPLSGVQIKVTGSDGKSFNLLTGSAGQFSSPELSVGTALVNFSFEGYIAISNLKAEIKSAESTQINQSLSPNLLAGQIRIVLNWTGPKSGAVKDVDAYLTIPSDPLPIFFDSRLGTGANLDIDILEWRGPETITITQIQNGTYKYYVNNYDTRRLPYALGQSDVRISVYRGASLVKTYTLPPGFGITYEVFHIINGQIVDVQRYTDDLDIAL